MALSPGAWPIYARVVQGPRAPTEIAYYYPEPYWLSDEGGWVKSLLLFFDEIAILLPSYMRGRHIRADPNPRRDGRGAWTSARA